MNEDNLRKLCADKAMEYIKNNTVIGLGAGRSINCLIELLSRAVEESLKIKVVTPSDNTKKLCIQHGIEVIPTCFVEEIDVAFDGCGEVDENFYALKSGGGVHTKEKLIGSMSKQYILLVDEGKLTKQLSCRYPVSLEVVRDSLGYVSKMVRILGGDPVVRSTNNKDGYLITDDGNFLLDVKFENVKDFNQLNDDLNDIVGVIETSLFMREVTKLIVAGKNGVRVISKA
ncbi:ribose 5-phosphate isomerase A [Clostridium akagii]|uniref:ribose 5-phosphate isomerase A n=1 Tax=Clostridium akagii TaxID=91623 RepID=UPI00047D472F|nr:ribose 5-phosphate isomerase A [Clostridium akagii]